MAPLSLVRRTLVELEERPSPKKRHPHQVAQKDENDENCDQEQVAHALSNEREGGRLADRAPYRARQEAHGPVESEESSSPIEAPISGEVLEVNAEALENPDIVELAWVLYANPQQPPATEV